MPVDETRTDAELDGFGSTNDGSDSTAGVGNDSGQAGDTVEESQGKEDGGEVGSIPDSGEAEQSSGSPGNASSEEIRDSGQLSAGETTVYEGVTASRFDTFDELLSAKLDAMNASLIVLVVALFVCAGILAVGTLMRSFEK